MRDAYDVELHYAEPVLRRAVRVFVWRRLLRRGWLWLSATGLLLASVVLGWRTGPSFAAGLALASLLFLAAIVAVVWRAHFVNTVGRYRAMDPPSARFTFDAAAMTVASNLGASTLPWSSISAVWKIEGAWMLFLAANQFMILPIAGLCDEAQTFLRTRLPEVSHG